MTGTLPAVGAPLHWDPWIFALFLVAVTPGVHLLLSPLVERRRVTWRDDYPAVLIGDPLLAVAAGLGLTLADGRLHAVAHWTVGIVAIVAGIAFGRWQVRSEVSAGRYSPAQAVAPTKLWHQYVVYPLLGYLAPAAIVSGLARAGEASTAGLVAMVACLVAWAVLTLDAIRHPRLGHGAFDWSRRRAVPVGRH